ncbi:DUF3347 domain-containing protein [Flavobacterium xinjiangense]|uniref:Uncharacterized protein n=1 Tax=Flavobacterium xinjiangense TaxID=178356 RepID=A0A1M7E299_9FLAO|nr:DUF3347 domain-containing protein [Flavobacterium xinjiangense]SHL85836.1 Protein of unknown function [Flavobacterium xinjiangense]
MKNVVLSAIAMTLVMVSCNQKNKETPADTSVVTKTTSELYSCPMHPEITGKKGDKCSKCGMELTEPVNQNAKNNPTTVAETKTETTVVATPQSSFSINQIVSNYLKLKNALVKDDSKGAANASKTLYATLNSLNSNSLDAKLKKEYVDIADDAKEHAEHIGDNPGKIEHQREHFAMLSKDINDLIKTFGTTQKLYQDYCPMYDEGKSGYWISETKEIKNPYYGSQMLTCGSVKKTF